MLASNPNNEVKHEIEINSITILRELKLFFMNNKYRISEPQNCSRYNSALEMHNAELVYDEEERIHKLWVNDEPLEPKDSIKILTNMIASLQIVNAQSVEGVPNAVGTATSSSNTCIKAHAGRDVITVTGSVVGDLIINNSKPAVLDGVTLNAKEAQALAQLKMDYGTLEYTTIPGIFGSPLTMEAQYINLQMLCTDLKTKKTEESKELTETKHDEKYKDARMASVEDLFGDKRTIKTEDLFQSLQKLSDNQESKTAKDLDEAPRLLLVQGRAGIGKTIFVRYVVHQWSKGQFYANYTWVFILTLRKLRLLPEDAPALSLSEWIRQSQFSDWSSEEFEALWRQRIEPAMNQNKVLLILDGYDEVPERHPCQDVLDSLLHLKDAYQNLSLLVTSRPFGAEGISEKRRNLEIIGFIDENIHQYIQTYFLKVHDKRLIDTLTKTLRKQPVIWANAHIPLNLNLLCGIMEDAIKKANIGGLTQVPAQLSSMTRMYQVMEKKLYERSYGRHDIVSFKTGGRLMLAQTDFIRHYQKERRFLAKLAFQSFEAEHIIIPMQTIGAALQVYVDQEIAQCSQQNIQQEKAKLAGEFFEKVCRLGLIKPVLDMSGLSQTEQAYEFLHLTFQEYYTAIYLAEGSSSEDLIFKAAVEKVILREKYNPHWQIVWWFVAGLLRENALLYKNYLEQLQGLCGGQAFSQDIFEHYQLGLLTRCVDEGFEPHNVQVIEPIVQQLQFSFLKRHQIAKNLTLGQDGWRLDKSVQSLALIKSPFFSACRISPNLCMGEQDLYALLPKPSETSNKCFLLAWIGAIQVVTPKVLLMLVQLSEDDDSRVRDSAARAVGNLGAAAATPQMFDALAKLLADKGKNVRDSAARALGRLGAAVTPQFLDTLAKLLANENNDARYSAQYAVGRLGAAAATPQFLDTLAKLLAGENKDVRRSALDAVSSLGTFAATSQFMDALAKLLADKNSGVRYFAARAVDSLGAVAATPQMFDALTKLLADKDSDVRYSALDAMGKLGAAVATPQFLDVLTKLLADEVSSVRRSAAEAVGRLDAAAVTPQILDALANLLVDEVRFVRRSAISAMSNFGAVAVTPQILDALAKLLADKDDVRSSAARAVGNLGVAAAIPQMFDALAKLLADKDKNVRDSAAEAVGKLGVAATPQFLDALAKLLASENENESENMCDSAAKAVGKLGVAIVPQFLDALAKLLTDKNSVVNSLGAAAATSQFLDALATLLADKDGDVRRSALDAVRSLGAAAATPQFLDALAKLLADEDNYARYCAAWAVGSLGAAAATPQILDALTKLLVNEGGYLHSSVAEAVRAVGKLGAVAATPQILDTLPKLLADKNSYVCSFALDAVGNLGAVAATPQILDTLAKLLANENEDVRRSALDAVGKLGAVALTPQILDALAKLLVHEGGYLHSFVAAAVRAVGKLGAVAATPQILHTLPKLLADKNSDVCRSALDAMGNLGAVVATPQILDALAKLLANENEDVRRSALDAVGKLGAAAATPQFLDVLTKLLADKNSGVRCLAAEVVDKLGGAGFRLLPSFCLENASHPDMFNFVSNSLATAYLSGKASCQIYFDEDAQFRGYYMRSFIEKSIYCFFITQAEAQCLHRLSSLVVKQLSETGSLNMTELKAHLPEWEEIVQSLLLCKQQLAGEDGNVRIHLLMYPENAEQKNPPILRQYQGVVKDALESRFNQDHKGDKRACRIS